MMMKKRDSEDDSDLKDIQSINSDLIEIFVKLYCDFVEYARSAGYPPYILQLLKEEYQAAFEERQQLLAKSKGAFRLTDYYAERPNNLWLQIEREMLSQITSPHKLIHRKGTQ